jgi:hypothetical protein
MSVPHIDNVVVTNRAWAIFRQQLGRQAANARGVIVLHYMPRFVNADGSTVDGFAPGYTIDFVAQAPESDAWIEASLPDGSAFRFMPKFAWRADENYVVDQASAYTLSIGPVALPA